MRIRNESINLSTFCLFSRLGICYCIATSGLKELVYVVCILFFTCAPLVQGVQAAERSQEQAFSKHDSEILFVRRIGPLLREKCLGCHGSDPDEIEGSLDVRSLKALKNGGDSGEPAIIPGKPEQSPLYLAATRVSNDWSEMPPKEAEQLTKQQLTWLRDWITSGAVWPDAPRRKEIHQDYEEKWSAEDGVPVKTSGGLSSDWTNRKYDSAGLWAYQPVRKPKVKHVGRSAIDLLIENVMPRGLVVASRADRRTLIRRATYDLTGLPPTPQEVHNFLTSPRPDNEAFSEVIDRLLKSPHYGERMAQHWLDVTRYADSSGFANDYERGNAWRYRDYVVRSFNEDKPYDQFVREQIAGDEIDSSNPELLVATGFLRMGPWELTGMEVARVARQRFLDDVTNSVGETFLGHSLQCARCHDHKFDPIPTSDYYSIQAVFATTQLSERQAAFMPHENTSGFDEKATLQQRKQDYEATLAQLDDVLLKNAEAWFADREFLSTKAWNQALTQAKQGRNNGVFYTARSILLKQGVPEDEFPPKHVGFTPQQFGLERVARKGLERLAWEMDRYRPFALAVYNGHTKNVRAVSSPVRIPNNRMEGELEHSCILTGGDPFAPGQRVSPGTLSVINDQVPHKIPIAIEGRRTHFANWVVDPKNPLTTRVIVNRIWQWHFGEGIARNANNFGSTGKRPTHPELLDWLAATFVEDCWSIKAMHRRIMKSDAYCRSTLHSESEKVPESDPIGIRYAVFKPRRLSAEELRDSMLMVTGELNSKLGGIPCRPEINQEVALQPRQVMGTFAAAWTPNPLPDQRNRRSIYVLKLRGLMDPMLETFNLPAPDFSCERRESSTVTPQVFTLFNSQNTYSRALALANRVLKESSDDHEALVDCFNLILSREPRGDELDEFMRHWQEIETMLPKKAITPQSQPLSVLREAIEENTGEKFSFEEQLYSNIDYVPDLLPSDVNRHVRALADVCLVILNSNEFVYVY